MNLSGLGRLGKVAGIGGISIGAVLLLFNALIPTITGLPAGQQAGIVKLLAILGFTIGVIGIIAWAASRRPMRSEASTEGSQAPAVNARGNVNVRYGVAEPAQSSVSKPRQVASPTLAATARTAGDQSPAVVSDGDATVRYGPGTPTKSEPKGTK